MNKNLSLLFALLFSCVLIGQTTEFNKPWEDTSKAIIIDPYYANQIDWVKLKTDTRVVAIIHKSSEGLSADPKYSERKNKAKADGYLWGSYHLGKSGDPIKQADYYLKTVGIDSAELLALDIENLDTTKTMSLFNAEKFILHVHNKTGRYPLIYCNDEVFQKISNTYSKNSTFAKCGLWYARFKNKLPSLKKTVWESYVLWQFSCELNCTTVGKCLYNVPGVEKDMDINVYNGTILTLRKNWPKLTK